jgi:hypothetical protein
MKVYVTTVKINPELKDAMRRGETDLYQQRQNLVIYNREMPIPTLPLITWTQLERPSVPNHSIGNRHVSAAFARLKMTSLGIRNLSLYFRAFKHLDLPFVGLRGERLGKH